MGAALGSAACSAQLIGPASRLAKRVVAADPGSGEFDWLPEGMGKRSVRWRHEGRELVLQVRPSTPFYEPVVEACSAWTAAGVATLPLLAWGALPAGGNFYVFPFVGWPTAGQALLDVTAHERIEHAEQIGMEFARLSTVATTGFGEFKVDLRGMDGTWFGFLERRAHQIMTTLSKGDLTMPLPSNRVQALLRRFEPLLADVAPRLLYVDVTLNNVLLEPDGDGLRVIDYDYLLSGDTLWIAGRIAPLYGQSDIADAMRKGLLRELGHSDMTVLPLYELLQTLELLTTPIRSPEHAARSARLLRALEQWQ